MKVTAPSFTPRWPARIFGLDAVSPTFHHDKIMKRSITRPWIFLLVCLQLTSRLDAQERATVIAAFEDRLRADVAADNAGSITAAVFQGTDAIWTGSFGWADRDGRVTAERRHIYRVGSISKTVTAVIMMQLVERGVVQLDDPVTRHLPEFSRIGGDPDQVARITLRQLASHTSGLIREPRLRNAAAGPIEQWVEKVMESIPMTSLQAAPGTEYSYSNIGYGILGLALSRAAGQPFMDLVNDRVFAPLGYAHDVFIVGADRRADLATGYTVGEGGRVGADAPAREHRGRGYKVPNGGIYNTIDELGAFAAALGGWTDATILTPESRSEMRERHTPADGPGYGLGLSITTAGDGTITYGHGGSVAGYNASVVFEPRTGYAVVLLRNYDRGATNLGAIATQTLLALVRTSLN